MSLCSNNFKIIVRMSWFVDLLQWTAQLWWLQTLKEAVAKGCGQKTTVYMLTAWVDVSEVEVYCVVCSAGSQMSLRLNPTAMHFTYQLDTVV